MKLPRTLLTLGAVTAALLSSTVTSAEAATTYTPSGGPAVGLVNQSTVTLTDAVTGDLHTCATFTLSGTVSSPGTSRGYAAATGSGGPPTASLGTVDAGGTGGCWNSTMGAFTVTALGTARLALTGDAVGGVYPAKVDGLKLHLDMANCKILLGGPADTSSSAGGTGWVSGTFEPATQQFVADPASAGLVIATPPTGSVCGLLGYAEDDPFTIEGATVGAPAVWRNLPPTGSSGLLVAHP